MKPWNSKSLAEKILIVLLALAIVGTLWLITYTFIYPRIQETFTDFYILGKEGKADEYPEQLHVNETAQVTIGVVNHEGIEASYLIEVKIDGATVNEEKPIVLKNSEKREQIVSFTPTKAGNNEKVEFFLYRDSDTNPYLKPLVLWINVTQY